MQRANGVWKLWKSASVEKHDLAVFLKGSAGAHIEFSAFATGKNECRRKKK
jgi:hypothetical protein